MPPLAPRAACTPPARTAATARHPRRRAPSPQRIQRRPRAPPTCAARARLHRHAPPCVSVPPPHAQSRSSHTSSSPRSRAAFASPRRSHIHSTFHPVLARCSTFCLSCCLRAAFVFRTPPVAMGREKRKGKEVVVEKPARKRTRAEKEAARAEMVAKAAEEQASGRARPFAIREQPGRGRGRGMGRV